MRKGFDYGDSNAVEQWADIGSLGMRYLDWGGGGPPVIALHGLASSANWYDLLAPRLSSQFRVIAPDQRGHGQTTQASTGYDWHTLSSDVVGLMDFLNISSAPLLGHSWGGNVAINVAALHPDRVSSLVMIDGGFFSPNIRGNTTWEEFRTRLSPRNVSGTRQEFLSRMRSQLSMCWNDDIERIVQTMVYEDNSNQIQDILRPEHHAQVIQAMWETPASDTWPNITSPTLIVPAGPMPERKNSEFALTRQALVEAAENAIPNSQVHWIYETVHDIGFHKPDELADVVKNFLAS